MIRPIPLNGSGARASAAVESLGDAASNSGRCHVGMTSARASAILELELQSKLDLTRWRCVEISVARWHIACGPQYCRWRGRIEVVQDIKELGPELHVELLRDLRVL